MSWTPTRVAVAIAVMIAVLLGSVAIVMQFGSMLTDSERPLQIRLDASSWPTPHPTATPYPTPTPAPTPAPTPVPAGQELLWLGERYGDSVTGLADASYQTTSDAFVEADFAGLGATVSATNAIRFGECVHTTGFPWMRVALATPTSHGVPTSIASGGLNVISALVLQMTDDDPAVAYTMDIGDEPHHLLVSRARLDCRAFKGATWIVE